MLQNYFMNVKDFRNVKIQADHYRTRFGTEIPYKQYIELLLSSATSYDNQHDPSQKNSRDNYIQAHNNDFNIDTDITKIFTLIMSILTTILQLYKNMRRITSLKIISPYPEMHGTILTLMDDEHGSNLLITISPPSYLYIQ